MIGSRRAQHERGWVCSSMFSLWVDALPCVSTSYSSAGRIEPGRSAAGRHSHASAWERANGAGSATACSVCGLMRFLASAHPIVLNLAVCTAWSSMIRHPSGCRGQCRQHSLMAPFDMRRNPCPHEAPSDTGGGMHSGFQSLPVRSPPHNMCAYPQKKFSRFAEKDKKYKLKNSKAKKRPRVASPHHTSTAT